MSSKSRSSSLAWRKTSTNVGDNEEDDLDQIPLLDSTSSHRQFQNVSLLPNVRPTTSASLSSISFQRGGGNPFEMRSRGTNRGEENYASTTENSSFPPMGPSLNPSFVLVDIPIEQGDTLPSFAIKYHVTTSELKRLNNMFHDQDFHGRQKLKVPIHKYGILAERFLTVSDLQETGGMSSNQVLVDFSSNPNSPSQPSTPNGSASSNGSDQEVTQNSALRAMFHSQSRAARIFLQNMDKNLQRLAMEAQARRPRSPVAEDDLLNNPNRIGPLADDGLGCESKDCAINLKALLCMLLLLAIVLPAAFLFYKLYCLHHPYSCSAGDSVHPDASGTVNRSLLASHHDPIH